MFVIIMYVIFIIIFFIMFVTVFVIIFLYTMFIAHCAMHREVEVADGIPDPGAGLPDPFEYFEKVSIMILIRMMMAIIIRIMMMIPLSTFKK